MNSGVVDQNINPAKSLVNTIVAQIDGVLAASSFAWFGGKYQDEILPFAQFGVDPDVIFTILDEFTIPADQLKAFQENKDGCVIGRKLATDRKLKLGDKLPLKGDAYPIDLNLTVRGIYDGPSNRDLRMCLYRFDYFDDALKRVASGRTRRSTATNLDAGMSGNAAAIYIKCKNADAMAGVCKSVDDLYHNSDYPTRTQTEEAFGKMFSEMLGDLKNAIIRDRRGGRYLADLRCRQCDGDGHARADDRGCGAQGDRIQQGAGLVPGLDRVRAGCRRRGRDRCAGLQGIFRNRRHLAVHGRLPPLLHHSLEHRCLWPGGIALDRLRERVLAGRSWRPIRRSSTGSGK